MSKAYENAVDANRQQGGRRNLIINGAMQVAQRGTSTAGVTQIDGFYACDRWRTQTDTGTWTLSQDTDAPNGFGYSYKFQCTSAGTSNGDEVSIRHHIEGQDLQSLAFGTSSAKSFTVSFWMKSNKTGTYTLSIKNLNSSQERMAGFNYTIDTADTWEKKTITFTGDTSYGIDNNNSTGFQMFWWFGAASALTSGSVSNTWQNYSAGNHADSSIAGVGGSTDDYVNITGVQLEVGSVATPFEHRSYGEELALCQRYYQIFNKDNVNNYGAVGQCSSSTTAQFIYPLQQIMRTEPTVSTNNATYFRITNAAISGVPTVTSISFYPANTLKVCRFITTVSSGLVAGDASLLISNGAGYGQIYFDAEL
jgi:hypothetical protein